VKFKVSAVIIGLRYAVPLGLWELSAFPFTGHPVFIPVAVVVLCSVLRSVQWWRARVYLDCRFRLTAGSVTADVFSASFSVADGFSSHWNFAGV